MSTIIGIGAPPASHLSLFNLLTSSVRPLTILHVVCGEVSPMEFLLKFLS